jgi:hypothetical protein
MKKSLLFLLSLIALFTINILSAQEQKEVQKTEKSINVENENGEITVTITEKEGDQVSTEVLTGEEAEKYLEEQHSGNHFIMIEDDQDGEHVIKMEMKMEGDGENNFVWVSEDGMDFDFSEIEEELEVLRNELDELNKEEIAERLDEIIEMKEQMNEVHVVKMAEMHDGMYEWQSGVNCNVNVEEKDGVMIITKTIGDSQTIEEIIIDEDNNGKQIYVVNSGSRDKSSIASSDNINMSVYPNPNEGNFTIELDLKTEETANVKVIDSTGKEVYSRSVKGIDKHELKVKLKKPSAGVYVILVEQGNKKMKLKTIIK